MVLAKEKIHKQEAVLMVPTANQQLLFNDEGITWQVLDAPLTWEYQGHYKYTAVLKGLSDSVYCIGAQAMLLQSLLLLKDGEFVTTKMVNHAWSMNSDESLSMTGVLTGVNDINTKLARSKDIGLAKLRIRSIKLANPRRDEGKHGFYLDLGRGEDRARDEWVSADGRIEPLLVEIVKANPILAISSKSLRKKPAPLAIEVKVRKTEPNTDQQEAGKPVIVLAGRKIVPGRPVPILDHSEASNDSALYCPGKLGRARYDPETKSWSYLCRTCDQSVSVDLREESWLAKEGKTGTMSSPIKGPVIE